MRTEPLQSTASLRRVSALGVLLSLAMLPTRAEALPEPKVTITYSLEAADGGAYHQMIADTPGGIGDVDYVVDIADPGDPKVTVFIDSPLMVTIEYTADAPGGNIVDGPVELTDVHFEREFDIDASGLTLVHTELSTVLSRKGTGTLSGSTISWDNVVAPYQESVVGLATCTGFGCGFVSVPFPRDLSGTFDVVLPDFSVLTTSEFADAFASDNGTPNDRTDDIDRPDPDATVTDLWEGVEVVPEPAGEVLLIAGVVGLAALHRLRERGGAPA